MTDNASEEWRETTLGESAVLSAKTVSPSESGDVPYIGLEHIAPDALRLSGNGAASDVVSAKTPFQKGDILFGKLRPYFRKVALAPFDGICSTDIWVVKPAKGVDARFLFYAMANQDFVDMAARESVGTRMPRAKWEYAARYEFPLPPISAQRRVSAALGALDDKIELNARMNETLDETARALFRAWFVDFAPVRAKMSGAWRRGESAPGLPAALYDAFPDAMADSALGEIPAGWEVKGLGDFAPFTYGKGLPKSKRNPDGGVPIYGSNGIIGFHDKALTNGPTIVIGRKGTIGAIRYSPVPCWPIDTTFFVESDSSELARFRYYAMSVLNLRDMNSDTAVPGLNRSSAHALEMLVPSESASAAIAAFGEYAAECDNRIRTNTAESRALAAIRDTLLPKLLSGEISA